MLPKVPGEEQNADQFKVDTLKTLFNGQNVKFGNPFDNFKMNLINGKYNNSDHLDRKRKILERYRRKKQKLTLVTQHFKHLSDILENESYSSSKHPSLSHEVKRLSRQASKKLKTMNLDERVGKRHITELRRIRLEVAEKGDSSDDEDFINELMAERERKMRRLKSLHDCQNLNHVNHRTNQYNNHVENSQPPPLIPDPALISKNKPNDDEIPVAENHNSKSETEVVNNDHEISNLSETLPDLPALEEINKHQQKQQNSLNTSLDEPESNFFSLLRYFFRQVENHALTIPDLTEAVKQWETNANHTLVTWIGLTSSWTNEIPSAVAFLCGSFPASQPPGFNPLIVADSNTGLYQWVEDEQKLNDANLSQLASWWYERRSDCQAITSESKTEPVVNPFQEFQDQERVRILEKPQNSFVYEFPDERKVQVGPVQNPPETYFADKVMQGLVTSGPTVHFYTLMHDALHRLENKRGSLEDITNLIKQSQFLNPNFEATNLLKKTALALTHFQKGQMKPFCVFDPNTRQYVIGGQPRPPVPQPAPRPTTLQQLPQQPNHVIAATPQAQQQQNVVLQRNVSHHLVQVRTPQGMKLYRLASPGPQNPAPGSNPAQARLINPGNPAVVSNLPRQAAPAIFNAQPQPAPVRPQQPQTLGSNEDTVIVRNSDGRFVQMPRSILKKLINSGQLKQSANAGANQNVTIGVAGQAQQTGLRTTLPVNQGIISAATPGVVRVAAHGVSTPRGLQSSDVLNLLPTAPVRQEHLHD